MVIFCLMRRLILRTNYLSKEMLNDIENKVLDLHEKFKEKFGVNKYENLVGANLYFNNIYEKSIVSSLNINGKSEQDGTPTPDEPVEIKSVSGVENLFDKDNTNILNAYFDTSTTSITYSDANRTLYIPCKENTTYTISKYLTRVFNIGYTTSIPASGVSVNGVLLGTTGTYDGTKTSMQITTGTNAKYLVVRFIQTALDTVITEQQALDSIMIEKGSIVHDYVPYGHWLKVKNTGKNLIEFLEIGGINTTTGLNTTNNTRKRTNYIEIEPNETYSLSSNITTWRWGCFYDRNKNFISNIQWHTDNKYSFTSPDNAYYFREYLGAVGDISIEDIQEQLEKGTEATSYEPYQERSMLIDMNKFNLFDYEDESNYVETTNSSIEKINNGIRVTNKIAGTYKFARYKIENDIVKTMLGKTYKFSCNFTVSGSNNGLVAIYWSSSNNSAFSNILNFNISGNSITFTLPSEIPAGAEYISLLFYSNKNSSTVTVGDYVDYTNIKLYEGSGDKDYYELCSIGDAKDELNIDKDGNVSKVEIFGESILDGVNNKFQSKHSTITSNTKGFYRFELANKNKSRGYGSLRTLLSNYFLPRSGTAQDAFNNYSNGIWWEGNTNYCYAILEKTTLADANNWLKSLYAAGTPVTVKYLLDEPQIISLGKITSLKLLKGINNITINDELQPSMTSSINCLNLVETSLRNIKVNDYLNNKTIHLSFPFESYENIDDTEHIFIVINENLYFCYKPNHPIAPTAKHISYKYKDRYNFLYHKYNTDLNSDFNYIRYKLPEDYGKVSSINENDIFYKFVKIKDDEYKLQEYNKKTWVDNEMPYLQYIDNIEEGINNVAEILYKPSGYEYKEWTTTGYYGIKSNDYGLAQKPISSKDFDRWNRNIELLKNTINSINNIWNVVSYIDWDEISQFEWEEN